MKSRWNTLRRSVLALLCSAAMICSGLMPMAVQADGPDMPEKPVFDPDEVTWITIAGESFFEADYEWVETGTDEDGDPH